MKVPKRLNNIRKRLMIRLTKNVGSASYIKNPNAGVNKDIKRVLISRPNGRLGNILLITPLIQDVVATFPNCKIDLFVKGGLAEVVFKNYPNVDRIIQLPRKPFNELLKYINTWIKIKKKRYDLVINVVPHSSSGRLSAQFARAGLKIFGGAEGLSDKYPDYNHIAKHPVYDFRNFLTQIGFEENTAPIPPLDLKLSAQELEHGNEVLKNLVDTNKKTLSIFTFATGAKCYSEDAWELFYNQLLEQFPNHNIVEILPKENVSQIDFKAPTFYSNDVREIAAVIASTEAFIGADSGIMHLASASLTPTIGLFGFTNPETFGPYANYSTAVDTRTTSVEQWLATTRNILDKARQTAYALGLIPQIKSVKN
ncbi:glycosyltransferase family 9 protein [Flavobacterium zepuense]|uniref:Glycosyltransferase family 9 protein n=2 Tax=Flavobacterium zepuense TaxID=2593302 RepID=A0A552UX69_9FLAO|nr:glycosyltransferase family 9 protein [Flavobacterium zepuense]